MDGISAKEQVEFLVKRKLPDTESKDWSLNWSRTLGPILVEELPPFRLPPDGETLEDRIEQESWRYEKHLKAMSTAERNKLFKLKFAENKSELDAKSEELTKLYNRPDAAADIGYWSKAPSWTIDEAVALSLGKSPDFLTWEAAERDATLFCLAEKYSQTRNLVVRAVQVGELSDPIRPAEFVAWSDKCGLNCPRELVELIQARDTNFKDWKAEYENLEQSLKLKDEAIARLTEELQQAAIELKQSSEPPNAKILSSLQKILLGVALEQYGYDSGKTRSDTAKQIAGDCALHDIKIHPETVRTRLREAAEGHQP